MARPKQPEGYPSVFAHLIESVIMANETLELELSDNKKAQVMRFQFYDFIKACRKSDNEKQQELGEMAYGLVFSIKGSKLIISLRDREADAQLLKDALQEYNTKYALPAARNQPGSNIPSPASSSYHPPQTGFAPVDSQEDMIASFMKGEKK